MKECINKLEYVGILQEVPRGYQIFFPDFPAYKGRGHGVDRNTALSDANRWIGMIVHFSRSFGYTLKPPSTSSMLVSGEKMFFPQGGQTVIYGYEYGEWMTSIDHDLGEKQN